MASRTLLPPSRWLLALVAAWLAVVAALVVTGDPPARATTTAGAQVASGAGGSGADSRDPTLVRTETGWVRGHPSAGHVTFSGIPYAAPPTGERRWAPPQAPRPWRGVRDATEPADLCPQWGAGPDDQRVVVGDEDCLYLNVTVPTGDRSAAQTDTRSRPRRPVIVWIYGGAFVSGAGSQYGGARLAEGGDVVVVTMNYRLGPLGFLSTPDLDRPGRPSGNYGLQDQAAALRWVQRNVARFGGDPDNVTLAGQSAGARSVCAHLAVPGTRRLVDRAIMQSGPCANPLVTKAVADQRGAQATSQLGCSSAGDVAACLRSRPVADVLETLPDQAAPLTGEYHDEPWMPVVGTPVLPEQPLDALARGTAAGIPVLIGSVRDEVRPLVGFRYDAVGNPLPEAEYRRLVEEAFGPDAAAILARYPAEAPPSPALALAAVLGDWGGRTGACPMLRTAHVVARHSRVFAYEMAEDSGRVFGGYPLGAYHSWDLPFVWDVSIPDSDFPVLTPEQRQLSDRMITSWTAFARSGDPNTPGSVPWAELEPGDGTVQSLTAGAGGIGPVAFAERHHCDLWLSR